MAAVADPALPLPPRDEPAPGPVAPREDLRVRCTSRRAVAATLDLCGRFVQQLGESLPDGIRELAVRDAQWVRNALDPAPQIPGSKSHILDPKPHIPGPGPKIPDPTPQTP